MGKNSSISTGAHQGREGGWARHVRTAAEELEDYEKRLKELERAGAARKEAETGESWTLQQRLAWVKFEENELARRPGGQETPSRRSRKRARP